MPRALQCPSCDSYEVTRQVIVEREMIGVQRWNIHGMYSMGEYRELYPLTTIGTPLVKAIIKVTCEKCGKTSREGIGWNVYDDPTTEQEEAHATENT